MVPSGISKRPAPVSSGREDGSGCVLVVGGVVSVGAGEGVLLKSGKTKKYPIAPAPTTMTKERTRANTPFLDPPDGFFAEPSTAMVFGAEEGAGGGVCPITMFCCAGGFGAGGVMAAKGLVEGACGGT